MRVIVAPDKFKGSATAEQVAAALTAGLRRGRPGLEVIELPVADGGDGTVAAAVAAGYTPVPVAAEGPTGEPVEATYARKGDTAVIELADVAGLRRLPGGRLAPLTASTFGVGQVIAAALDGGATRIVLGIGGSATTDGGAGMLQALGARLTDASGNPVGRGGAALARLAHVDLTGLDPRLAGVAVAGGSGAGVSGAGVAFVVACDVDNPLLGKRGAAEVFARQKGASDAEVAELDVALARWATATRAATGRDVAANAGAGAAGGTGFAALAYLGAELVPGIDLVLSLIGFEAALDGASVVVTGEGSLDHQTLGGKAPHGVARVAGNRAVPVVVVAGRVLLTSEELASAGFAATYALNAMDPDADSMAEAIRLLELIGRQIARSPLLSGG
jgi:glycerate kinase